MRQQRELAENSIAGRKSDDIITSSPQMSPRSYFSEPKIRTSNYDSAEFHPRDEELVEMSVVNETQLSNGHTKKDRSGNYNSIPSYEQSLNIDSSPTKLNGVNEKGDDSNRNGTTLRNRKPNHHEITTLNLCRLRRNMAEISSILKESGISLDEVSINE